MPYYKAGLWVCSNIMRNMELYLFALEKYKKMLVLELQLLQGMNHILKLFISKYENVLTFECLNVLYC